ncbi:MAG: hypothetical protein IJE88_01040 [Akkermansia sp.]|nr:hypothetical protein [Akkermansia sp.]
MKHLLLAFLFAPSVLTAQEVALPANHVDMTTTIIEFLSRTELCLNTCRDEASVKAAIPQLQELKQECDKIVEAQRALPEPTIQDYMAVQNQVEAFNTVWNAIRDHIERLEQEQLLSDEMRNILHIAASAKEKH